MEWRPDTRGRAALWWPTTLIATLVLASCNSEAVAPPKVVLPGEEEVEPLPPCEGRYCHETLLGIYGKHEFYRKIIVTNQIAVVGSHRVEDRSLEQAIAALEGMIMDRQVWWGFLVEGEASVAVMSASETMDDIPEYRPPNDSAGGDWAASIRSHPASAEIPVTTIGEENLLCAALDANIGESVLVHELAHTLHDLVISKIDPNFDSDLSSVFQQARADGLWANTLANTNYREYWAEGVQSWFDANQHEQPGLHNHVNTRAELAEYDPRLRDLLGQWFGDGEWTPTCPAG